MRLVFIKNDGERKKDIFLRIIGFILLFILTFFYVGQMRLPQVVPDEFGYWTAAAYINRYDWSGVAAFNSYYAIGYGFILSICQRLFDGIYMYRFALALNGIYLGIIYLLLIKIANRLFGSEDVNYLISFMCCLYPSFLANSLSTQPEIFMALLIVISVNTFLYLIDKVSVFRLCIFVSTLGIGYCIHQRMLAVLLAGVISCILLLLREKGKKRILYFIIMFMVLSIILLLGVRLKNELLNTMYYKSVSTQVNDYSGQLEKVKGILSFEGAKRFILVLASQLWQLSTASILFVLYAIYEMLLQFYSMIKKRHINSKMYVYIYIFLCFCFSWGISAVFMRTGGRIDSPIYGRYIEIVLPVILLIGVKSALSFKHMSSRIILYLCYLLMGIMVRYTYSNFQFSSIVWGNISGIFRYIWSEDSSLINIYFVEIGTLVTVFLSFIMYIIIKKQYFKNILLVSFLTIFMWILHVNGIWEKEWSRYQDVNTQDQIAEMLKRDNINNEPVYFIYEENEQTYNKTRSFPLQLLMKEEVLNVVEDDNIEDIDCDSFYIVVNKGSSAAKIVEDKYKKIMRGSPLELYHTWN